MAFYLGVTGGIASGKSYLDELFRAKGVKVIDADEIAHNLMQKGQANWQAIVDNFGEEFLTESGEIDRKKLGQLVFNNPSELKKLNRISHQTIRAEITRQMEDLSHEKLVIVDIPLLFEGHFEKQFDAVLVVDIDEQTQLKRLMSRNNLTKAEAKAKISSQMSLEKKRDQADYLIDNTGTIEETASLFEQLWSENFFHIWRN